MLAKIISCQYGVCYAWYKDMIGQTVKVKPIGGINKDFMINDKGVSSMGTIYDSCLSYHDLKFE